MGLFHLLLFTHWRAYIWWFAFLEFIFLLYITLDCNFFLKLHFLMLYWSRLPGLKFLLLNFHDFVCFILEYCAGEPLFIRKRNTILRLILFELSERDSIDEELKIEIQSDLLNFSSDVRTYLKFTFKAECTRL